MKTTVLIFALLISVSGVSQVLHSKDQKFVRVYDLDGNKVLKGRLYSVSDSTLTIRFTDSLHTLAATDLGAIKFKRSIGSNALTGSLIGGGIGAIVGGASADPDPDSLFGQATVAEGVVSGFVLGLPIGAAVGGLTGLLRKKREIYINGDLNTWITFKNNVLSGGF
ncbi:hypothetical protein FJ651_06880 [Paucihalobacter ruber]|uniref:Glycine zipper domain-containing protein n=1 Tax=Paucihalobacter ruber TaxID=2567861 RepID=A0A506PK49_9FLAO|nr:hypothetical protein [Paucihalobacter ruber]TPV33878.1 hypothetical protein FJ651_06880 [Paucihalobacter ruber]